MIFHEMRQQTLKALDLYIRMFSQNFFCHSHSLIERENGFFIGIRSNCNNDFIENISCTFNEVNMTKRDRIKGAWINRYVLHNSLPSLVCCLYYTDIY